MAPEVAGIVKDYYFESGNDVEKGTKLVELDTSVEEADLVRNRAVLLEANADLKRQASLVKKEFVSQAVVDTTTSKRDTAAASVQRMEAVIAQKNITAPFAGRLGLRRVEKGQYVKAGDPLSGSRRSTRSGSTSRSLKAISASSRSALRSSSASMPIPTRCSRA